MVEKQDRILFYLHPTDKVFPFHNPGLSASVPTRNHSLSELSRSFGPEDCQNKNFITENSNEIYQQLKKIGDNFVSFDSHGWVISFDPKVFSVPNTFFSLLSITARARINIEELVSTPTELIFIVAEKDFGQTVALFSELHRKINI